MMEANEACFYFSTSKPERHRVGQLSVCFLDFLAANADSNTAVNTKFFKDVHSMRRN